MQRQQDYCRTRKATLRSGVMPHYRDILPRIISETAERFSILRSDAWLALELHSERNPTGSYSYDVEVSQSFFEHVLKYCSSRDRNINVPPVWVPPNPNLLLPNAPYVPFVNANHAATRPISLRTLWETCYNFVHPAMGGEYMFDQITQAPRPIRLPVNQQFNVNDPAPIRLSPMIEMDRRHEQLISLIARDMMSDYKNYWGRRLPINVHDIASVTCKFILGKNFATKLFNHCG